jgi:hypothetical protein
MKKIVNAQFANKIWDRKSYSKGPDILMLTQAMMSESER